ncbi:MAG: DUF1583 domain-containing protein [Planctomycetales bacterium]|nr:DUF1583 domain-containing protein [Planctomycetales bacterium]
MGQDTAIESVATRVMLALRDRDPEGALEVLDKNIDQTLGITDLVYSDLPSAAAGLHRSLAQVSSDGQYELLEAWTLPNAKRNRVRVLSVPVPTDAPPRVFARSIGERPRETTFVVASVGHVQGFFCSGWMLLQAANDLGQLARLRIRLEELEKQQVTGAKELLVLSQLLGPRGDLALVNSFLVSQSQTEIAADSELTPGDINVAAIAAAATLHEETQATAEAFLGSLVARSGGGKSIGLRPFLRIAHAIATQAYRGQSPPDTLLENRLSYWVPVTIRTAKDIERGHPSGLWLTHENHILHLAGGTADVLFCRFPLVGSFDFICETQEGSSIGTDGGLVYGGLQFQALGRTNELTVWDADAQQRLTKPSPFARTDNQPVFNRVSIRSTDEGSQFESNFHPVWFDGPPAQSSPWIGLRSSGAKRPVFRNLQVIGNPAIPKEIHISSGDELRGWQSTFYGESQPMFRETGTRDDVAEVHPGEQSFDWQLRDGEIIASDRSQADASEHPGLLRYQRPLLDGDSIAYEFMFAGESSVVHPAVGRLAFLLESGGVRLRYLTTGASEWSGLAIDNAALEPLYRKGPRRLPLKENDWNSVRTQIKGGDILVHLNDQLIYQRPIESRLGGEPPVWELGSGTQFGLYRATRTTASRIRNVVMTGEWPDSLPEEFISNPVAYR